VGSADILAELEAIAPLTAVWGNTDSFDLRKRVPEVAHVELGGVPVVVLHGMQLGSPTPEKAAARTAGRGSSSSDTRTGR
jgi:predicted phosphodiesterase